MKSYYFDHAAATPMSSAVKLIFDKYAEKSFFNPSAGYSASLGVKHELEYARSTVAKILGAKSKEITFVAGGSEANNLAIRGVMDTYPHANCIVSAIEHPSILEPAKLYNHKILGVMQDGRTRLDDLKNLIDDKTVLVSVMYVNNEIGTIQPLAKVSKIIGEVKKERLLKGNKLPLFLHTDACQAPNYLHLFVNTLGVDMMTLNGGKIYGPKQTAVLYAKHDVKLKPLVLGGGQEKGRRSGTENVAGFMGFSKALEDATNMRGDENTRLRQIFYEAVDYIEKQIPTAIINGSRDYRIANNIHISLPGYDNEEIMMKLDERGFMVAVGSACKASSDEPSHVLKAIGLGEKEAEGSIRITSGRDTTSESVLLLLKNIKQIIGN